MTSPPAPAEESRETRVRRLGRPGPGDWQTDDGYSFPTQSARDVHEATGVPEGLPPAGAGV